MATCVLSSIMRLLLKEQSYSSTTWSGYSTDGDALQPALGDGNAAAAHSGPLEHYTSLVMDWALRQDPHQKAVVQTLDKIHKTLRVFLDSKAQKKLLHLLYGDVGTGKTMVMDMFYSRGDSEEKEGSFSWLYVGKKGAK